MNSNSSPLETPDLLRLILELLPPADLARAACVCKLWKDLASDRDLLERAFRNPWKLQRVLGFPSTEGFWRHTGLDRFAISHCLIPGDTIVGLAVKYSVQRFFKMGIFQLFIAASVPVIKVLIVTGVGAFIATDYIGVLGEDARKHLNNVVFYVFNPALVATNLSKTVTLESVVLLWFMPINILLTFLIGSAFGWVIIKITKAPHQIRGLILGCCSAGNLGNLLLITVPATCKEKGSPFGAPDVCTKYGLAYCSLSMAIGAVFLWSYVYNIVRISSRKPEEKPKANDQVPKLECTVESTYMKDVETSSALVNYKDGCEITQPLFAGSSAEKKVSFLQKMQSVINFRNLFAPSTIGVIIGFIVGVITPIRKALIGESAPLRVIQDSASLVSDGAIPSLTLILGGNLLKGFRGSSIRAPVVIGVIFVRYLLLPLVGIAIVKGAVLLGLVHVDPLYQFVLLVQYALPPAMNIGTITQLFGAGESECSVLFFWTYVLASVSLTLWSTYFMWLVS